MKTNIFILVRDNANIKIRCAAWVNAFTSGVVETSLVNHPNIPHVVALFVSYFSSYVNLFLIISLGTDHNLLALQGRSEDSPG